VIAAASTPEKLRVAADRGADALINYSSEKLTDRVVALTDGAGANVCFDPVGGELFHAALSSLGWGGRILIIGFVAGVPSIPAKSVARQEPLGARQRVTLFPLVRARQAPALRRLRDFLNLARFGANRLDMRLVLQQIQIRQLWKQQLRK
jgi:NADPH:quinone reductase-like Zn-dependent oxidoreductase